jgi:hypothetical protein
MKICIKCNQEKELNHFYKNNRNKTGYDGTCKVCKNEYTILNNKKLGKEYFVQTTKKWINKNKNKVSEYNRQKYDNNKEYWLSEDRKLYYKEWRNNNKDKLAKYNKNKYNTDINFKLSSILRYRLYSALKLNVKIKSAIKLIDCSIESFKQYIELKFKPEMNWDNHGDIWEIDHIIPCSSFDLTDLNQQKQCFHYTNMQPLFKTTKIAKSLGYGDEMGNRNKSDNIYTYN